MHVCIINEFFYPDDTGGTGTVLSDLARRVADGRTDIKIDVITSWHVYRGNKEPLPLFEEWDGISIHRLPSQHPNGLSLIKRSLVNFEFSVKALIKLFSLKKFDVVLISTAPPFVAFAADLFKRLTGTPYVYIVYDLEPDRSLALKLMSSNNPAVRALRLFQSQWLKSATRIVVLGRCMQTFVANAYKLPLDKIDVIPIGANELEILPGSRESRFRYKHGIKGFTLLYSGNFGRYHNFDTILDAAKALLASRPDVTFVLVGRGAQKDHITTRIFKEKISNVQLFDFVDLADYPDLLATADATLVTLEPGMEGLCVPSKFYSFLASGRAVIGVISPKSEVALVIDAAKCGKRVDHGDTDALITAIQYLDDHPEETILMGQNARKALEENYSTRLVADQYYNSFCLACNSKPISTNPVREAAKTG